MKKQFMITFTLPDPLPMDFIRLVPEQRDVVNFLLAEGILKTYALSADRTYLWAVLVAHSEFEVLEIIEQFPLSPYLIPEISELALYNSPESILQFSLN